MILEKNKLQTVQEWTKSYIELIALYVLAKNSNHLRSQVKAIMVLDHSRLGLEKQILGNKSRPNFLGSTSLLYKILPTNLGCVNQPFIPFIHQIWGETVLWGAVCFIQTSDTMLFFTILQYKLHSFDIQDDRSTRGPLAGKTVKNISKITSRCSLLTSAKFAVRAVQCLNEH